MAGTTAYIEPVKNGVFSYSGKSFPVYVISLSYPWNLELKGSSQARQGQVVYPFRMSQGDVSVTLQFPTVDEMRSFANWCRGYHLAVTSYSGQVNSTTGPNMRFTLTIPSRKFKWNGVEQSYNGRTLSYDVLMPSIPYVHTVDSVAPTMRLTLKLIGSPEINNMTSASQTKGTVTGSIKNSVTAGDVKTYGDSAYGTATINGQGLVRGGH